MVGTFGFAQILVLLGLTHEFELMEELLGVVPVRKKRLRWPWFPSFLFLLQTFASFAVITLNAMVRQTQTNILHDVSNIRLVNAIFFDRIPTANSAAVLFLPPK